MNILYGGSEICSQFYFWCFIFSFVTLSKLIIFVLFYYICYIWFLYFYILDICLSCVQFFLKKQVYSPRKKVKRYIKDDCEIFFNQIFSEYLLVFENDKNMPDFFWLIKIVVSVIYNFSSIIKTVKV